MPRIFCVKGEFFVTLDPKKIDFSGVLESYFAKKAEFDAKISEILTRGNFINGDENARLTQNLQNFIGAHAIPCGNGTDALFLALKSLGIGCKDEVITSAFSFFASAEAIVRTGATPVFCDVCEHDFAIDPKKIPPLITKNTRAILAVSIFGAPCDLRALRHLAKSHGIFLIEDFAQSFGARLEDGHKCGSVADVSATSFFPAKPFGCFGDGGAVFTRDENLAREIKMLANHGAKKKYFHERFGINSRLDEIQAGVLNVKFQDLEQNLTARAKNAKIYRKNLENFVQIQDIGRNFSTYAQFVVLCDARDELQKFLHAQGIPTAVHYPSPLHAQPAFSHKISLPVSEKICMQILSLPVHPFLSEAQILKISDAVKKFIKNDFS